MKFFIFVIFNETFLEQQYECKWVSWWCHRLTIFYVFCIYKMLKIIFFAQTCKCISPYQNKSEQTLFCIYSEWILGKFYFLIAEIWNFFVISVNKIHRHLWGDDIIISLTCIHIDCSRNVSLKIMEIQNFISSLFSFWFRSNFHCSVKNSLLFLLT